VTVLSHHHLVRVVTCDTLLIQMPDGQRVSALVLDRTAGRLRLALPDGQMVSLALLPDDSLQAPERGAVFSQQKWLTN
jgi:hypothetical protein